MFYEYAMFLISKVMDFAMERVPKRHFFMSAMAAVPRGPSLSSVPDAPTQTHGLKEVSKTRSVFPETWLWSDVVTR